ncbi:TonB-dependent receptor [Aquimarina sp. 2201CG5-10]|uniref:TonB-dependent receptor n=1 Tax=Aquimarina callyspongiae TaxID=3098150 RepID=UPI002AB32ADF|nr:TonB-dependent receptor [Aquimarina sp. 2201CG5-10]MDY8136611.1 TonB-dependent receptor [Aquimarina sp. 2201CG5-10]
MKKIMFCGVLVLMGLSGFSQSNNTILKGIIKDANTGYNIPDVSIQISEQNNGAISDIDGRYQITLPTGQHNIQFSAIGYSTITQKITLKDDEQTLNVGLPISTTELSEVIIQSDKKKEIGVNQVSKISLKLRPINSAQDLLKTVPGLFIAQHAGGGKAEQIFLRGFDNDHGTDFAVFVDDIPVNLSSHAHGQGYADLHFLIPETVGDANYYKGPHEAAIGNFAVSGAASYTTKGRLNKNSIKLEYGQYDFVRALGIVTLLDKKNFLSKNYENAYIAIEGTYNKSFFDSPQNLRRLNTFSKYTLDINDQNTLTTSVSTFHSNWNASGQIPLRAVQSGAIDRFDAIDDTEGGDTERVHINFQLESLLSDKVTLKNQVFYLSNIYNLYSNFTFFQNDPVNGDMIHQFENRNMLGYNGKLSLNTNIGNLNSKTDFGLSVLYNDNKVGLNNSIRREILETVNIFKVKETNYSAYIREQLKLTNKLSALVGLRGDYFTFRLEELIPVPNKGNTDAFRLSPKISLFYDFTEKVQLYAKASSGFHSNYSQAAVNQKSIHPLPKAVGYDLGTEFKIGNRFIANIAAWYLKSNAEFVFVSDGFEFENKGRSERIGGDASFRYQPLSFFWLDTDLNYSYGTLIDEPKEANKIPSAPRFTSTGGATLKLKNGIKGSLRYRFLGERPLIEDESVIAEDYFLIDAVINYTQPSYEIGLSIENIFDQEWTEAVFYDSSQLQNEPAPVDDFHFTPGNPFLAKLSVTYFF